MKINILEQADYFLEAFNRCSEGKKPHKDEFGRLCFYVVNIPALVNAAFACELYFKSMIGKVQSQHNLKKLFVSLPEKHQKYIRDQVNDTFNKCYIYTFDDCLDKSADTFIQWRYIFEKEHTESFMGCYINQHLTFFGTILPILKNLAHNNGSI